MASAHEIREPEVYEEVAAEITSLGRWGLSYHRNYRLALWIIACYPPPLEPRIRCG
jgi:hypothetical protein